MEITIILLTTVFSTYKFTSLSLISDFVTKNKLKMIFNTNL